jgi:tRNA nucleotidyltransferase (CCA-adding enzyme)
MDTLEITFDDGDLFVRTFEQDVYVVGGGVRETLRENLGQKRGRDQGILDLLVLHHTVDEITRKLQPHGRVDLVGKSFGVIKFTRGGHTYDIALPRKDVSLGKTVQSHRDFVIDADPELPIEKDLARRDFRCNSIAVRLTDGGIIDPFKGREDIQARMLRLTNPAAFPDDPLRVLRAARFASVLEYTVDPDVYAAAKEVDLSGLSVERINEELYKILMDSPRPSRGLEELFMLSALRQLYPELFALTLSIQDSEFHPEKDRYGHHSVWQHTKNTVDQASRLAGLVEISPPERLALLLSSLLHDVGKPATAAWEFKRKRMIITNYGHDIAGEKLAGQLFDRFRIFSYRGYDLRSTVLSLIRCHHRASELWSNRDVVTKKAFNRLAADLGGEIELLIYLDAADRAGRDGEPLTGLDEEAEWLLRKFEELNVNRETIQPLILGRDLIALGVDPGPGMGRLLKELYQMQLDNVYETKEAGLDAARRLVEEKMG